MPIAAADRPRDVALIVVPWDSARRDERMGAGPRRILDAGLVARLEQAGHRVVRSDVDPPPTTWRAEIGTAFELARGVARAVGDARARGQFPLLLAGNCGVALGAVAALGAGTAVLWLDAHGDFNTPDTTTGGFLDGMALATVAGHCWRELAASIPGFTPVAERRIVLAGARDLDPLEERALGAARIARVPARDIDEGLAARVAGATGGATALHLHIDLDVLDPAEGRANQYAVAGGATLDGLVAAVAALRASSMPAALTLSAYDPAYDADGRIARAALRVVDALLGCS